MPSTEYGPDPLGAPPRTLGSGGTLSEIRDPVSGTYAGVRMVHGEVIDAVRLVASAWDRLAP